MVRESLVKRARCAALLTARERTQEQHTSCHKKQGHCGLTKSENRAAERPANQASENENRKKKEKPKPEIVGREARQKKPRPMRNAKRKADRRAATNECRQRGRAQQFEQRLGRRPPARPRLAGAAVPRCALARPHKVTVAQFFSFFCVWFGSTGSGRSWPWPTTSGRRPPRASLRRARCSWSSSTTTTWPGRWCVAICVAMATAIVFCV